MSDNMNKMCPYCDSEDVELYSDGSGSCKSCKKSFSKPKEILLDLKQNKAVQRKCRKCGINTSLKICPDCGTIIVCRFCGGSEIKVYKDKDIEYEYCTKCGTNLDAEKLDKFEYECNNCGADLSENDKICPKCGERFEDEEPNGESELSRTGYFLMVIGAIVYLITFIVTISYAPNFKDIQESLNYSRIMAAIGFLSIFAFMIGSIVQIKALIENGG
ncbi:MAG: zinc ribbon domain-containing protein [Euryarchaeota archaeon]|nr:zinc ribbon domain-containing protein [Euryarchaeota archaeon]